MSPFALPAEGKAAVVVGTSGGVANTQRNKKHVFLLKTNTSYAVAHTPCIYYTQKKVKISMTECMSIKGFTQSLSPLSSGFEVGSQNLPTLTARGVGWGASNEINAIYLHAGLTIFHSSASCRERKLKKL